MASADWSYVPGDEVEVNAKTAKAWEEAGIATIIDDDSEKKRRQRKKDDE